MLGGISRLPLRVIRGVIRRLRPGRDAAPEVKLPIRTDPDGPNLKPSAAPAPVQAAAPAPAPVQAPAPSPVEAPVAAAAPAPVEAAPTPAPVEGPPAAAPSEPEATLEPATATAASEPTKAKAKRGRGKKAEAKAEEPEEVDAPKAEPAKEAPKAEAPKAEAVKVRVRGEPTPNPNAMKFSCSVKVIAKGSVTFNTATAAAGHRVGEALFLVPGVRSVFAVNDFVTVTKEESAGWSTLAPAIEAALQSALS